MPRYDEDRFAPPAPIAQVDRGRAEAGAAWLKGLMLIDSGADVTLVPRSVVDQLGIPVASAKQYELVGFDGTRCSSPAVRLRLRLLGRIFEGLFVLIEQEHGILGRNILNALPLVLDGPRLEWDELQRP